MQQENAEKKEVTKVLDLDRYRLKMKLRDSGVEWHEDTKGKFKIWLRLGNGQQVTQN